ncbi:unnamed protein product [Pedinophyceae sp. YPF-701]|nr:unnamed protein product [Pedinophyceae sp. YPF-701]
MHGAADLILGTGAAEFTLERTLSPPDMAPRMAVHDVSCYSSCAETPVAGAAVAATRPLGSQTSVLDDDTRSPASPRRGTRGASERRSSERRSSRPLMPAAVVARLRAHGIASPMEASPTAAHCGGHIVGPLPAVGSSTQLLRGALLRHATHASMDELTGPPPSEQRASMPSIGLDGSDAPAYCSTPDAPWMQAACEAHAQAHCSSEERKAQHAASSAAAERRLPREKRASTPLGVRGPGGPGGLRRMQTAVVPSLPQSFYGDSRPGVSVNGSSCGCSGVDVAFEKQLGPRSNRRTVGATNKMPDQGRRHAPCARVSCGGAVVPVDATTLGDSGVGASNTASQTVSNNYQEMLDGSDADGRQDKPPRGYTSAKTSLENSREERPYDGRPGPPCKGRFHAARPLPLPPTALPAPRGNGRKPGVGCLGCFRA